MASPRTSGTPRTSGNTTSRVSFAKIREPLEVPNLLHLQTTSFDWLVGNDDWRALVAAAVA